MNQGMKIKPLVFDHHRNGVCGAPFDVVIFDYKEDKNQGRMMIGVLFEERGSCAVFDLDLLSKKNIRFGENSWRGDHFEDELRDLIKKNYEEIYGDK